MSLGALAFSGGSRNEAMGEGGGGVTAGGRGVPLASKYGEALPVGVCGRAPKAFTLYASNPAKIRVFAAQWIQNIHACILVEYTCTYAEAMPKH